MFASGSNYQISKFCWSASQELLLRSANFAALVPLSYSMNAGFSTSRIPKDIPRRNIPIALYLKNVEKQLSRKSEYDILGEGSERRTELPPGRISSASKTSLMQFGRVHIEDHKL